MKVHVLVELDEDDIMGQVLPRVAARVGATTVTNFAASFDRKDIEATLGEVVTQAIEQQYKGWLLVRELFKPPVSRGTP